MYRPISKYYNNLCSNNTLRCYFLITITLQTTVNFAFMSTVKNIYACFSKYFLWVWVYVIQKISQKMFTLSVIMHVNKRIAVKKRSS